MQFANNHLVWLLFVPLGVWLLAQVSHRAKNRAVANFADPELLPSLLAGFEQKQGTRLSYGLLLFIAVLLLTLTLLRPQWGFSWQERQKRGVDIVIAVDVSESMLAEDVSPNRLTRARREILDLLENLKGDRIALVSFAGIAFLETPLTLDYGAFRMFLDSLKPELIPIKGSNIESALLESIKAFEKGEQALVINGKESSRERALLLITDGEDFEGDFSKIATKANKNNVHIYIIGVGTTQGAPISLPKGYKRDKKGDIVISKLVPQALAQLAENTGGIYVKSISSDRDTLALYDFGIHQNLEGSAIQGSKTKLWNEYYQVPLLLSLVILLCGVWGRVWGGGRFRRTPARSNAALTMTALILLSFIYYSIGHCPIAQAQSHETPSIEELGALAKRSLEAGKFDNALRDFERGSELSAKDYRFALGKGASSYRLGKFSDAASSFQDAFEAASEPSAKATAIYNAANSLVQMSQLEQAIKLYQQGLTLAPNDQEMKDNLEYTQKLVEEQKKEENKEEQENEEEKKEEKDNKQDKDKSEQQESKEESEQGDKQEENEKEQSETKEESGPEEKEDKTEEKKEKAGKKGESENQQQKKSSKQGKNGNDKQEQEAQQMQFDQLEAQLDNLDEKTMRRLKFRLRAGMKQLESQERNVPEKDW